MPSGLVCPLSGPSTIALFLAVFQTHTEADPSQPTRQCVYVALQQRAPQPVAKILRTTIGIAIQYIDSSSGTLLIVEYRTTSTIPVAVPRTSMRTSTTRTVHVLLSIVDLRVRVMVLQY